MINLKRGISSSTKFKSTKLLMVAHGYQTMLTFDYKVLCQMKNSNEDSDFFLRDSWLETWLGWDLWWNVMQPTYGKYTAAILWLRLLLLFPRMLEYTYFKSISQHESGQAKGLKVVYVCKVFGAESWLMVAIVAWPSNLSLRGIREFSGFKINIYDHWF